MHFYMLGCWSGGVPVYIIYKTTRRLILVILMHLLNVTHGEQFDIVRIALKIRSCRNLSSNYAPLKIVNHVS